MVSNHGNILSNQSTKDQKQMVVDGDLLSECKEGKKKEKKRGCQGLNVEDRIVPSWKIVELLP